MRWKDGWMDGINGLINKWDEMDGRRDGGNGEMDIYILFGGLLNRSVG